MNSERSLTVYTNVFSARAARLHVRHTGGIRMNISDLLHLCRPTGGLPILEYVFSYHHRTTCISLRAHIILPPLLLCRTHTTLIARKSYKMRSVFTAATPSSTVRPRTTQYPCLLLHALLLVINICLVLTPVSPHRFTDVSERSKPRRGNREDQARACHCIA